MNPGMSPAPAPAPLPDEELKAKLRKAIETFNINRVALLKKAFQEGGDAQVDELLKEHDDLRDAFFEILARQLDRNSVRYLELVGKANNTTDQLQASIDKLDKIADIIDKTASVISAVGRALVVLG